MANDLSPGHPEETSIGDPVDPWSIIPVYIYSARVFGFFAGRGFDAAVHKFGDFIRRGITLFYWPRFQIKSIRSQRGENSVFSIEVYGVKTIEDRRISVRCIGAS
ncbi:MAG: hypothetical protein J5758_05710 [Abditibacteriota bacterium]|nr:hypothetical protein [Abditibacteriota bacterium]